MAIIPATSFNTRSREKVDRGHQSRRLCRLESDFAEALTLEQKKWPIGKVFRHQLKWVGPDRPPVIVEEEFGDFLRREFPGMAHAEDWDIARPQCRDRERQVQSRSKVIYWQEWFAPQETAE